VPDDLRVGRALEWLVDRLGGAPALVEDDPLQERVLGVVDDERLALHLERLREERELLAELDDLGRLRASKPFGEHVDDLELEGLGEALDRAAQDLGLALRKLRHASRSLAKFDPPRRR
jgi:hypothetical protein